MTDNLGRKRFHGAFEGGFSAGYFNTVGSAHGWEPSQYISSKNSNQEQHDRKVQSVRDFLDDDELEEYDGAVLKTKAEYDTFGRVAKERMSQSLAKHETGSVPLLVPDVMMTPVSEGIGVKLLLRMGWRQGKGLDYKDLGEIQRLIGHAKSLNDIDHVIRKGLRASNTLVEQVEPKFNMFGLGYDPFEGAEEFRHVDKRGKQGKQISMRGGVAFGTGALEDADDIGMIEDYVSHDQMSRVFAGGLDASGKPLERHQGLLMGNRLGDRLALEGYTFEIQDDIEDTSGKQPMLLQGPDSVKLLSHDSVGQKDDSRYSILTGFVSVQDDILPATYPRPRINHDYKPTVPVSVREKSSLFSAWGQKRLEMPSAVPTDSLKTRIDQIALQVAHSGPDFERIALSSEDGGHSYSFITPGDTFHAYYLWKVQRLYRMLHPESSSNHKKHLDSVERSAILGEPRLEKTFPTKDTNYLKTLPEKERKMIQERMAGTFVKAALGDVHTDTLQPGLTTIEKKKSQPTEPSSERKIVTVYDLSKPLADATVVPKETLERAQQASASGIPIRRVDPWDPEPLLCKRLGIEPPRRHVHTQHVTEQIPAANTSYDPALEAKKFLDLLMEESKQMKISDTEEAIDKPTNLFQAIFEGEEEEEDMNTPRESTLDQFRPIVVSETTREGMIFPQKKPISPQKNKPNSDKEDVCSDDISHMLDDARIKEALRIVQEAERKKREKKERKREKKASRERSSKHRHSRDRKRS